MMKILGLTGNSGSGKSLVSKRLAEHGAVIIDADRIAAEILVPGTAVYADVINLFGEEYLLSDQNIDRSKLAALIFSDDAARERLNKLTHPAIIKRSFELAEAARVSGASCAVIEAALLTESCAVDRVDELWLVTAPYEQKLSRIILRDGLTALAAVNRLSAQADEALLANYAGRIIHNQGSIDALFIEVDQAYKEFLQL